MRYAFILLFYFHRLKNEKKVNTADNTKKYSTNLIIFNIYTIIALDGTTKDLPRWKLVYVDQNEKYVLGKTLETDKGIVERIVREVGPNTVEVKFKMPDGSDYNKVINRRELRFPTPQFESKIERDFRTK